MVNKFFSFLLLLVFFSCLISCGKSVEGLEILKSDSLKFLGQKTPFPEIENFFLRYNLINLSDIDSSIKVRLAYASDSNFTGVNLYGSLKKCYLPELVARKLKSAQDSLKKNNPDLSLIVLDAARPHSIQKLMWDTCKLPYSVKSKYLANPVYTSMHNYGAAIDLSIVERNGSQLDMGTPFDFFGPLAEPRLESYYLNEGKLTTQQVENRKLLRKVMIQAGFMPIPNEWWHFEAGNRFWVKKNLKFLK